jgi:HD superfamily phosphodiesterase
MNRIEERLTTTQPSLLTRLHETIKESTHLLGKYDANFPTYTDHSIQHTAEVFELAANLLNDDELENLNPDELYVLGAACILHDIGMCIPEAFIDSKYKADYLDKIGDQVAAIKKEDFIRDIHHELSQEFILREWEQLKIVDAKYAEAIALVAKGHRKVDLTDINIYRPQFFVKSGGRSFVCLPYLASILRMADELDVTNARTPKLLTKYYFPNSAKSQIEWKKHIATSLVNFTEDKVRYEVKCTDQDIYAALQEQFDKIQNAINYCQKIIRGIANTEKRTFSLKLLKVEPVYEFEGFNPKGIKYSFNVENVVTAFIGENLYKNRLTAVREVIQNSIDSCRYRRHVETGNYFPRITVQLKGDKIIISDNGMGMDEFIVEFFFARLASSYYEEEKVKKDYEAIGQFGVGVFSYFLISEYIDIETKTANSASLKFRIDKDPKSYFHFYDISTRTEPGTTITMFIKNDLQQLIHKPCVQYIKDTFRFIEFPIHIDEGESTLVLESRTMDVAEEFQDRVRLTAREEFENFKVISASIDTDSYNGTCVCFVNPTSPFEYLGGKWKDDAFRTTNEGIQRHSHSQVSISQKGVYVADYSGRILDNVVGNINLKKKHGLKIDRNSFNDPYRITDIIADFEIALLRKIIKDISDNASKDQLVTMSMRLPIGYLEVRELTRRFPEAIADISQTLYCKLYNKQFNYVSLFDLFKLEEFLIVGYEEPYEKLSEIFKLPTIIDSETKFVERHSAVYYYSISFGKYEPYIVEADNKFYVKMRRTIGKEEFSQEVLSEVANNIGRHQDIVYADSTKLLLRLTQNKGLSNIYLIGSDVVLNANHPVIEYLLENCERIEADRKFSDIVREFFSLLLSASWQDVVDFDALARSLNGLIKPIFQEGFHYEFTVDDFPSWRERTTS